MVENGAFTMSLEVLDAPVSMPGVSVHWPTNQRVNPRNRIEISGVLIDRVDRPAAKDRLRRFLFSSTSHQIVTVNLDFLAIAHRKPPFREIIRQADLAVADGMPLVWLSHLLGQPLEERVTGVELVDLCCLLAAQTGQGVFLLGGGPGVAESAARELEQRYPGIRIAGTYTPPFGPLTEVENDRILSAIRASAPGFLFVALGAPRQDIWIAEHRNRLSVPISIGVGCVLDLLAGRVQRAPDWMQHSGLEWLFRLAQEPKRLWRRYLVDDLPTLGRLTVAAAQARCNGFTTRFQFPRRLV